MRTSYAALALASALIALPALATAASIESPAPTALRGWTAICTPWITAPTGFAAIACAWTDGYPVHRQVCEELYWTAPPYPLYPITVRSCPIVTYP